MIIILKIKLFIYKNANGGFAWARYESLKPMGQPWMVQVEIPWNLKAETVAGRARTGRALDVGVMGK